MDFARECTVSKHVLRLIVQITEIFNIRLKSMQIYLSIHTGDICSSRWYVSNGMTDKVVAKLRRIAKINRRNPDPRIYDAFAVSANKLKLNYSRYFKYE